MSTATAAPPLRSQGATPIRLLRAELLKIWTTNTWWVFGILTLAFTALTLLINILQADTDLAYAEQHKNDPMPNFNQDVPQGAQGMSAEDIKQAQEFYLASVNVGAILVRRAASIYTSGQFFALLFMVILGALIVTNEFFHQTATTTFLTVPRRTHVILSKLGAAAVLAFGFWLVVTAIDLIAGSVFFAAKGYSTPLAEWPVLRSALMNLVAYVVWAMLGVGLGVLIRSQLGATLTGAAFYLLSFPIALTLFTLIRLYVIKENWVWSWIVVIPGVASQILISPEPLSIQFDVQGPPWWVGGLVLVGYGVLAGVVGTLITRKRDIS